MGIRELQDGKLYKMHDQKLDNTEKIERINECELTRQLGFGIINMLGGFLAVFLLPGIWWSISDKKITLDRFHDQGLSVILII
jgi:hypothetical protein